MTSEVLRTLALRRGAAIAIGIAVLLQSVHGAARVVIVSHDGAY